MKRSTKILTLLFILIAGLNNAYAATYYVATNGNDSYTNAQAQNTATPWKTIQKAANTLVAGDIVYIRTGTYKEQVTPKNSGSTGNLITYSAYVGETVTVDGAGVVTNGSWSGIFNISSRSYLQISNLRIINSGGFGILIAASTNIKILNNYIYSTYNSGVATTSGSSMIVIDGNELGLICQGGDQTNGIQEALSLNRTNNFTVSNNTVHDGGMEGIDAKGGSSYGKIFGNVVYGMKRIGLYIDAYSSTETDIDVYNNLIRDPNPAASGSGENGIRLGVEAGGTLSNVKVFNNVVYGSKADGINISSYHESSARIPTLNTISIFNNTVYGNSRGGIGIESPISISGLTIQNNIVTNNSSYAIQVGSGVSATQSNNFTSGNPLFVNAAIHDFHLQSNSPAINAGIAINGLTTDFDGSPRTGNPDIGAYEYIGTVPDVIVTSLSYNASTGIFTSVVKNQGAAATPAGVTVGVAYFVDGTYQTWGAVTPIPLAAGASATVGSDGGAYTIPCGTHTIMAFVDDANRFAESNENNNQFSQTITIGTPSAPTVGTITQPTCAVATGTVVLNGLPASGTWTLTRSPGGTTTTGTGTSKTISGLATGTYTFTVTNASGCTSIASANVIINAQPATPTAPTVGTITQPTCAVTTGSVVLNGLPSTGTWTLTRSPGGTTTTGTGTSKTISGLATGTYTFTVTNASGCTSVTSANVVINAQPQSTAPSTPNICIVGVANNKNLVVWEKPVTTAIDSFVIYRESLTATNVFKRIGSVSYDSMSTFNDNTSNPDTQSNRYEISAKSKCGVESALSAPHKTMHLSINKGVGNGWNLIWESYEGFTVSSYRIYRGTSPTSMVIIGSTAASGNIYSDTNAPAGSLYYQVEVLSPVPCNPTRTISSSLSNIVTSTITTSINENESSYLNIYPNPANDKINMDLGSNVYANATMKIYSIEGRLMLENLLVSTHTEIVVSELPNGIYFIQILNGEKLINQKLIVKH